MRALGGAVAVSTDDVRRDLLQNSPEARQNNGRRPRSCDSCGNCTFKQTNNRENVKIWACAWCGLHHGPVQHHADDSRVEVRSN